MKLAENRSTRSHAHGRRQRIESLHWIRVVTFGEDLSQIRTANGPAVMAPLRNTSVSRHRFDGATKIASACRHTARHPNRALALLTKPDDQLRRDPALPESRPHTTLLDSTRR